MERGAERILQLVHEGKHAEAIALMEREDWGVAGEGEGKVASGFAHKATFVHKVRGLHIMSIGSVAFSDFTPLYFYRYLLALLPLSPPKLLCHFFCGYFLAA